MRAPQTTPALLPPRRSVFALGVVLHPSLCCHTLLALRISSCPALITLKAFQGSEPLCKMIDAYGCWKAPIG